MDQIKSRIGALRAALEKNNWAQSSTARSPAEQVALFLLNVLQSRVLKRHFCFQQCRMALACCLFLFYDFCP